MDVECGPVEETSFDLGVPLVQDGQPYVREVCLEEGTCHQDGSLPLRRLKHMSLNTSRSRMGRKSS